MHYETEVLNYSMQNIETLFLNAACMIIFGTHNTVPLSISFPLLQLQQNHNEENLRFFLVGNFSCLSITCREISLGVVGNEECECNAIDINFMDSHGTVYYN
jgi:hypothetical protein